MNDRNYSFGVYYYVDSETGLIDYIGFDSHIDSKYNRNYQHLNWKPQITFDEVLQKNPDRWEYHIYKKFDTLEEADKCEYDLINLYRPRFNFKHGGINGGNFYQDFEYTVVKKGFKNGKQNYTILDRNQKEIKTSINKEALDEIAVGLNDGEFTEDEVKAFKYTVAKAGLVNGKQKYKIYDRNNNPIKQSINKEALDEIAVALNNGSLSEEEAKVIDLNPFEYTVAKAGLENGKQKYKIYDRNNNPIKQSINKEALDEIAVVLNNGEIIEEEVKAIDLNPFEYTVAKIGFQNGKQKYTIYDGNHNPIKQSINKDALDEIAVALNNGEINEEEVKAVRGVNKVLKILKR